MNRLYYEIRQIDPDKEDVGKYKFEYNGDTVNFTILFQDI